MRCLNKNHRIDPPLFVTGRLVDGVVVVMCVHESANIMVFRVCFHLWLLVAYMLRSCVSLCSVGFLAEVCVAGLLACSFCVGFIVG